MQLRWTVEAADDLERIADYLFENTPGRAADLVTAIYDAPSVLTTFPYRGRRGKKEGTRELVLSFAAIHRDLPSQWRRHTCFSYPPRRPELALRSPPLYS